jgi:hypothetical protein
MPLKLNVGLSRKMTDNNYGSRGGSVNLELELDSGLVSDSAKLQERIRQLFGLVRTSLAEELNGAGTGQAGAGQAGVSKNDGQNGDRHVNGNSQSGQPRAATPSQIKALYAITKEQGLDLNGLLRERFRLGKPEQLSIREASQLIDDLKGTSQERK